MGLGCPVPSRSALSEKFSHVADPAIFFNAAEEYTEHTERSKHTKIMHLTVLLLSRCACCAFGGICTALRLALPLLAPCPLLLAPTDPLPSKSPASCLYSLSRPESPVLEESPPAFHTSSRHRVSASCSASYADIHCKHRYCLVALE